MMQILRQSDVMLMMACYKWGRMMMVGRWEEGKRGNSSSAVRFFGVTGAPAYLVPVGLISIDSVRQHVFPYSKSRNIVQN